METTERWEAAGPPPGEPRRMSSAEWAAIGEDAKHVEDGRYYVLVPDAQGTRVVEIQFTDRRPRRTGARRRNG